MSKGTETLTIALTKGRILKETLPLFAAAGVEPLEDIEKSRKLIFPTTREGSLCVASRVGCTHVCSPRRG